jgi:phage shock protein E
MSRESLLGIVLLFTAVIGWWAWGASNRVSAADAHQLVAEGARLLDVRSPGEFASGHLDGALNIPVDTLDRRLGEVGEKDVPVVVYCRSGARSAQAARVLRAAGFEKVSDLGAMSRW